MLQKISIQPGFNKQVTSTGAEAQWTGGENVRFRYGTPEKIGGWAELGESYLTGVEYLKRTLSPAIHCPSAVVGVTCLLNPGRKPIFCNIEIRLRYEYTTS